ncbi:hypothetical protein [Novosphingobium sp.]|uniref:hypothetical protein n=1 Tax=Novosphingobium sp. TaxID=1874826 RepID=UPI0026238CA3|nr:hypothetical protein [Novosphingobium sp.]
MSSRELLLWVALLCSALRMAGIMATELAAGTDRASWSMIEVIVWGCAITLLVRDKLTPAATSGQVWSVVSLLGLTMMLSGNMLYVGLLLIGWIVLRTKGWSDNQRKFAVILMAIGLYRIGSRLVVLLLGDVILRMDTALAGVLMTAAVPGSTWSDNHITPPNDVGITVGMACSSFANLSLVSLCYTSIAILDGAAWTRRNLASIGMVWLAIILLNTVRLVLMARSLDAYEYWHNGEGAEMFGVGLSLVTVALCSLGSRWANRRC